MYQALPSNFPLQAVSLRRQRAQEKNQPRLPLVAIVADGHLGLSQCNVVLLLALLNGALDFQPEDLP